MSTHNLCLRAKIKKTVYPCKRQFYCIKVGYKGVVITRACNHVVYIFEKVHWPLGGLPRISSVK